MTFQTNPFLERASEQTTSDLDFVRLFSPKVLEKLPDGAFDNGVHVIHSAPGAGKTTLLRALTPTALKGFWNSRLRPDLSETFQRLVDLGVLDAEARPRFLGVYLSCAAGYADLPPGGDIKEEGLFRALLDCRIVLRTLRNVALLLGMNSIEDLGQISLRYETDARDLKGIPLLDNAKALAEWADRQEQAVYAHLDEFTTDGKNGLPAHVRFEGPLWLQSAHFHHDGQEVAVQKMLMIDDLHKLRKKQRAQLIDELTIQRPGLPIWLAQRSIALGEELLSQGSRRGRDIHEYALEELWSGNRGSQFTSFIQSIVERRMAMQQTVPASSFVQCLRGELEFEEIRPAVKKGIGSFLENSKRHRKNVRYSEWLDRAEKVSADASIDNLEELYVTRILVARDEAKRQRSFEIVLGEEELQVRDSSQVRAAAQLFMHEELKTPYYFGFDRLCTMATLNIEELLSLSAELYKGLQTKQILRSAEPILSPLEQEKLLKAAARKKRDFIPKTHTQGVRAQRLLDSIGSFCRERTFMENAPIAPGVTGVRLSHSELNRLSDSTKSLGNHGDLLRAVLAECVAENLLVIRESSASASREAGTIFYLNRTLCVHYNLPLQYGGWQDVTASQLIDWMEKTNARVGKTKGLNV